MLIVAEENPQNFWPLTLTRATFELRYGAYTTLERARLTGQPLSLRCRPELEQYLRAKTGLPVNEPVEGEPFPGLPGAAPWEILAQSNKLIVADWELWNRQHHNYRPRQWRGVHVVGSVRDIHLGARAVVQPGCVLDTSGGPIIIGKGAVVKWSQVAGPVFIGAGSVVEGARLRPGTSLGPNCKVGGEVSASIFQERVTKGHEGFVGHSWIGSWVNFGALATTSNLKNTLGTIRYQRDRSTPVDTGSRYLGAMVGDHTRFGIGQMINTGANIGACCNIFGGGVTPKYVPSFSWGGTGGWQEYQLDKCLQTMRANLAQRGVRLRPESEVLLRDVFAQTRDERTVVLHSILKTEN